MLAALRLLCRQSPHAASTLRQVCRGLSASFDSAGDAPNQLKSLQILSRHSSVDGSSCATVFGDAGGGTGAGMMPGRQTQPQHLQLRSRSRPAASATALAHPCCTSRPFSTSKGDAVHSSGGGSAGGDPAETATDETAVAVADTSAEELDDMLQQVMKEADAMVMAGQPLQAMQLLSEVAQQLEGDLGMNHFMTVRLYDQLAVLHHEQDNCSTARETADRVIGALGDSDEEQPLVHMFRLRRGAALFAMREVKEAIKDFAVATEFLSTAFSPDFEAIGEARFYLGLARLLEAQDVEGVERAEPRLREALKHMQRDRTNRGAALREIAMREHDRIIDGVMAVGNWPKAGALYEQQAALLRGAGMKGKLLYHLYTYSTLLFIRGEADAAEAPAREGLMLAKQLFSGSDDEVNLRRLRLGTILLERGRVMEAEPLLMEAAERFRQELSEDNPVLGEAAFALALMRTFQLLPFQNAERKQLLEDMRAAIATMGGGFGEEHQLVEKARVILESLRRGQR